MFCKIIFDGLWGYWKGSAGMDFKKQVDKAHKAIVKHMGDIRPIMAIILGSGMGELAENVENKKTLSYGDIPGFPSSSVKGHKGQFVYGLIENKPVLFMQGRIHLYENPDLNQIKLIIRTLKSLTDNLIITAAVGALTKDLPQGDVALVTNHINLMETNPLIGANDDAFGPRFPSLDQAYDPEFNQRFLSIAKKLNIPLHQAVYLGYRGPYFETSAETEAYRKLGGDVVGMSTIPEVIVARHCGLKVAALASITDYATGISSEAPSHENTLAIAKIAGDKIQKLLKQFIQEF